MASKKTSPASRKPAAANVPETNEYAADLALRRARLSGIALKSSTARNGGIYAVEPKENGTSVVLSGIFASAFPKKETVSASDFGAVLGSLFTGKTPDTDKAVEKSITEYEKRSGRKYGNFSTLRSRILGEIRKGTILSFSLVSEPARG